MLYWSLCDRTHCRPANTDDTRPRKFYRTSPAGSALADQLMSDMTDLTASLHALNGGTIE